MLSLRHPDHFRVFADLFAIGCILHAQGERSTGHALVAQVVRSVGGPAEQGYLATLLASLPGNELRFAREIEAAPMIDELQARVRLLPLEAGCNR